MCRLILGNNDLGRRNGNAVIKFTDTTNLRGIINTQENKNITEEELNDLVNKNNWERIKFNHSECSPLQLKTNNKTHWYKEGTYQLKMTEKKKDLAF